MKHALFDSIDLIVNPVPANTSASGEVMTGLTIDRLGKRSAVAAFKFGALTGSPTASAVKLVVKSCDTSDGTYEALDEQHAVIGDAEQTLEANGTLKFQLDLSGQKRYIKLVPKVALTGGTTPSAALAGSALVLGDADELPVIPC